MPETAPVKYLPEPKSKRQGIALCLSGGGFRAALFHLGALRRLHELGVLEHVDQISSVSGGSIMAAHLATAIGSITDWEKQVAAPFRSFTAKNLRTWPILKRYLLPWNWFRPSTQVEALARGYEKRLTGRRLAELPDKPRFTFCSTDMSFGVNWIFERERVGDYQVGYVARAEWKVARAVAASSCFPPVFDPWPVPGRAEEYQGGKSSDRKLIRKVRLTDGGVYDNMGLEPVWKSRQLVLVSDGGAPFEFSASANFFKTLFRYPDIIGSQAGALRKRWLISNFLAKELDGTYWGIASSNESYARPAARGYSEGLVKEVISQIRTDMDAFSESEAAALENHGYTLAETAISTHLGSTLPLRDAVFTIPHEAWMDEGKVREAMKESHKRKLLGRW